jgi:hypothetical protein
MQQLVLGPRVDTDRRWSLLRDLAARTDGSPANQRPQKNAENSGESLTHPIEGYGTGYGRGVEWYRTSVTGRGQDIGYRWYP